MHPTLATLKDVHDLCRRTDDLAAASGLRESKHREATPWGFSDRFVPTSGREKPHKLEFTRDVFLRPDTNIEFEYILGLENDFDVEIDSIYVAFRLLYLHEEEQYAYTVFYETVKRRWMESADMVSGAEAKPDPETWAVLRKAYRLHKAKARATPLSAKTAKKRITEMMRLRRG